MVRGDQQRLRGPLGLHGRDRGLEPAAEHDGGDEGGSEGGVVV